MSVTVEDRFWAKVDKRPGSCWLWTAATGRNGYGRFRVDGSLVLPHRFAYELLVGPIPEGMEIDHVRKRGCRSRACCNPAHLEPVTHAENVRRGDGGAMWAAKTGCPSGHDYDWANTYVDPAGRRHCRACGRARATR